MWPMALAGLVLPLGSAAWIAYRAQHPAPGQWPLLEPTLGGLWAHLSASVFRVYVGGLAPAPQAAELLRTAILPWLVPGLALLALALARPLTRRASWVSVALLAGALLQVALVLGYGAPDPASYFLPPLTVGFLSIPVAGGTFLPRRAQVPVIAALLIVAALAARPGLEAARAERARLAEVDRVIAERWKAIPFDRGFVLWSGDYFPRLVVYQVLEGERPGLIVESPAMLTWTQPRRAFERRFGVDPLAGLELRNDSDLALIAPNIARRTGMPVVDFERFRP
jgi:hypothetical protein